MEVKVQLRASDLHRYFFWELIRWPALLCYAVPIALAASSSLRAASGPLLAMVVLILGGPFLFPLLAPNKALLKSPRSHIFTPSGISTIQEGTSSFSDWPSVKNASETRHYLLIRLSAGFVMLPKAELPAYELNSVRSILRTHLLPEKAHLASSN